MALVKFVHTDAAGYAGIVTKDADTLYFVSDLRTLYRGDVEYGLDIVKVSGGFDAIPTKDLNTLYFDETTKEMRIYTGASQYDVVSPAVAQTITSDANTVPSTKAVYDYIAEQITNLDITALEGRVDTLEGEMDTVQGQITTINGEGEGSIKKALADAKAYTDQEVATKADLEHTHEIADVTDLQTTLDGKADKATTLAGYGITDAYTKGEADSAIATAVANADHLKREIVEALPEVGSADENTIYMVGDGTGEEENQKYEEFMLINGVFEKIGDSAVDLTGYATETFVTNAINALDVADAAVTNQYVSQVVQTDGKIAVTRVALPVTSVTEGSANGTIAVNGADVNVHGLGSAAYTNADDYEDAGTAAAAIAALDVEDAEVENQYVSAVSQTDGKITVSRKQLPAKPVIATGATNGTIAVDGVDVAVKGLGTAAYTASTDYATAAQGTKADQVFAALTWTEL